MDLDHDEGRQDGPAQLGELASHQTDQVCKLEGLEEGGWEGGRELCNCTMSERQTDKQKDRGMDEHMRRMDGEWLDKLTD